MATLADRFEALAVATVELRDRFWAGEITLAEYEEQRAALALVDDFEGLLAEWQHAQGRSV